MELSISPGENSKRVGADVGHKPSSLYDLLQGEIDICSNLSGFLPRARRGMKSSLITSISQTFIPAV